MNKKTIQLSYTALFATLIFVGTSLIKFNIGPRMMVHIGNALVILAYFALKGRYAMLAAGIGFGIFDLLNGYAISVHFTILESVIVIIFVAMIHRLLKNEYNIKNVIILSIVAAITKILVIFIRRFITNWIVVGFSASFPLTIARMPNSIITGIITAIVAPILYLLLEPFILKINEKF